MTTIHQSPSFSFQIPEGYCEKVEPDLGSYWFPESELLLQVSSYKRTAVAQVRARARLEDRMRRMGGVWGKFDIEVPDCSQVSAAWIKDAESVTWVHCYVEWPDLVIYATISGICEEVFGGDNWAIQAVRSMRRTAEMLPLM